jgi:hypothetical protein
VYPPLLASPRQRFVRFASCNWCDAFMLRACFALSRDGIGRDYASAKQRDASGLESAEEGRRVVHAAEQTLPVKVEVKTAFLVSF